MWVHRHLSEFTPRTALETARFGAMAWTLAPVVEVSLGTLGLQRTIGWLERLTARERSGSSSVSLEVGERVVGRAFRAHVGLRGLCLERALVQWAVHRLDGTPARFVIGVRDGASHMGEEGVQAHAWVEHDDDPAAAPEPRTTGQDGEERYMPLEKSGLRKASLDGFRGAA